MALLKLPTLKISWCLGDLHMLKPVRRVLLYVRICSFELGAADRLEVTTSVVFWKNAKGEISTWLQWTGISLGIWSVVRDLSSVIGLGWLGVGLNLVRSECGAREWVVPLCVVWLRMGMATGSRSLCCRLWR